MAWENFTREAETGTGADAPQIPDDLYEARVADVSKPETRPNPFAEDGAEHTQFYVTWELLSDDLPPDTTVRQYVTIPASYMEHGVLDDRSNIYKIMTGLGFDLSGRFRVDPPKWIDLQARVMTEQKEGKFARVTDVKPSRKGSQKKAAPAVARAEEEWRGGNPPAAAGAKGRPGLRQRLGDDLPED